jgi:parallel beta-helix repeat protein
MRYNNFSSNERYGIYLIWRSPNVTMIGNNFTNDGIFTMLKEPGYETLILPDNNLVNVKPIYFYRNQSGLNIDGISVGQLILTNCTNGYIRNLEINHTDVGLHLARYTSNINVTNNNISNNYHGLYIDGWLNNIHDNEFKLNKDGIYLMSSANIIKNNNISWNYDNGIYLRGLEEQIIGNNISNNTWGLYIDESSSMHSIYHNNFIDNVNQVHEEHYYLNYWDDGYPSGGNYWSDYNGNDNFRGLNQDIPGSDGIGDTHYKNFSYQIYMLDKYPLMNPYIYPSQNNYSILIEGWNLISIPLIQQNQDIFKVLESINGLYDSVQWYDIADLNDHWKHNKIGKSMGNDLFELNETMSFWIHITQPGETVFIFNGTEPSANQNITIQIGWNMVGYPSLTSHNRTAALNNLVFGTDVDAIQWYDPYTESWHFLEEGDYFEPGRGYWIHSKVDTIWEVPL